MLIAGILGAVGSVVSTLGAISQLQYQAAIAKANAQQQKVNAESAFETAQENARNIGTQRAGERGEIATARGGSGFSVGSLSFGLGDVAYTDIAVQEQTNTLREGQLAYADYNTRANIERARSKMYSSAVGPTALAGFLGAGSSLVSAAAQSSSSPGYIGIPQRKIVSSSYGLA